MRRPIYRLMKRIATRALIELTPETGRRNQIRVHLADAECTIIGDRKYGGMSIPKPPRSRCGRMNDCPGNVAKDAKYTVRSGPTGPIVALTYNTKDDEKWYMATESHPELVAKVNDVKTAHGHAPNGSFYINEYKQRLHVRISTILAATHGLEPYHKPNLKQRRSREKTLRAST